MTKLTTKSGLVLNFEVLYPSEIINGKTTLNIAFKGKDFNYNIINDAKKGCDIDIMGVFDIDKVITVDEADISVIVGAMEVSFGSIEFFASPEAKMDYGIEKDLYGLT